MIDVKCLAEIGGNADGIVLKCDSVGLPIAAGLFASRLQGHTMNSKENPLTKAGYDFGNTRWGTGEGWGYLPPVIDFKILIY